MSSDQEPVDLPRKYVNDLYRLQEAAENWFIMRRKVIEALEKGEKINMKNPEWDLGAAEDALMQAIKVLI